MTEVLHAQKLPTHTMIQFFESRWRMPLVWFLFAAIALLGALISCDFSNRIATLLLVVVAGLLAMVGIVRMIFPRVVLRFGKKSFEITGVRPGWWKLFQTWHKEQIDYDQVVRIQVGRIRNTVCGVSLPPLGEPSRNSGLQKFLWIYYNDSGRERQIYYPHVDNIGNRSELIRLLKDLFPDRLEIFGE